MNQRSSRFYVKYEVHNFKCCYKSRNKRNEIVGQKLLRPRDKQFMSLSLFGKYQYTCTNKASNAPSSPPPKLPYNLLNMFSNTIANRVPTCFPSYNIKLIH